MPLFCFHKTNLFPIICHFMVILTAFMESNLCRMCVKSVIFTKFIFYVNTGRKEIRKDCFIFTAVDLHVHESLTSSHNMHYVQRIWNHYCMKVPINGFDPFCISCRAYLGLNVKLQSKFGLDPKEPTLLGSCFRNGSSILYIAFTTDTLKKFSSTVY